MTSAGGQEISRQDIDGVAEKLQAWSHSLSDQEQLVMGWILTRAMAAGEQEVEGYLDGGTLAAGQPLATQLSQAAGFSAPGQHSLAVGGLQAHGLAFGNLGRAT